MKKQSLIPTIIILVFFFIPQLGHSQDPYGSYTPGSYNNYKREKDNAARAAKELERSHYSPSSNKSNTNSNINSTPAYFNAGLKEQEERRIKEKADYDRRVAEKIATYNDAAARWKAQMLARGHARTAEDHYDLMLLGYRNGYDAGVIHNVLGYDIAGYTAMYGTEGPPFKTTGGKEDVAEKNLLAMTQTDDIYIKAYFFESVLKAYPNAGNYGTMGALKMQGFLYEDAKKNFETALEMDNTNILFKAGYAAALAFAHHLPEAEKAYKDLVVDDPSSFSELNLAWVLMLQGKDTEALKHAEIAGSLDPYEVGALLVQAGLQTDAAKAKELADAATAIRSDLGT